MTVMPPEPPPVSLASPQVLLAGTACMASARALVREIENAIAIQNEGFEDLIRGSSVTWETLVERVRENWYLEALEAKSLGLVAAVI